MPAPAAPVSPAFTFEDQLAAVRECGAGVFSFTFGVLPPALIGEMQSRGMYVMGTATTVQEAIILARPVGDPALFLRAATALLELEGDGDLAAEARAAAKQIAAALPDEPMRRRFAAAEPVRLLGALD